MDMKLNQENGWRTRALQGNELVPVCLQCPRHGKPEF